MDTEDKALALLAAAADPKETAKRIGELKAEREKTEAASANYEVMRDEANAARDAAAAERNALAQEKAAFGIQKAKDEAFIAEEKGRLEEKERRLEALRGRLDAQQVDLKNREDALASGQRKLAEDRAVVDRQLAENEAKQRDLDRRLGNIRAAAA